MGKSRLLILVCLFLNVFSIVAFAKENKKPARPVKTTSSSADLYKYVWHCTFTVAPGNKTTNKCTPGTFNKTRTFVPTSVKPEHHAITSRVTRFLTSMYGYETYPYADAKSKKPIARPDRCEFELTHGETAEPADKALIRARSGTCPLTSPAEQFLFQDRLLDGLDMIVYEREEVPGGLEESNDD